VRRNVSNGSEADNVGNGDEYGFVTRYRAFHVRPDQSRRSSNVGRPAAHLEVRCHHAGQMGAQAPGDLTGNFWVVAIFGRSVIWYNDMEDGFDVSPYSSFGEIDVYCASQYELRHVMQQIIERISD
jgi:hypothetical protein